MRLLSRSGSAIAGNNSAFCVLSNLFREEVRLFLEGSSFHPINRVQCVVKTRLVKSNNTSIGTELYIQLPPHRTAGVSMFLRVLRKIITLRSAFLTWLFVELFVKLLPSSISFRDALPIELIGINATLMCQYNKFPADRLLVAYLPTRKDQFIWKVRNFDRDLSISRWREWFGSSYYMFLISLYHFSSREITLDGRRIYVSQPASENDNF